MNGRKFNRPLSFGFMKNMNKGDKGGMNKIKFPLWVYPDTMENVKKLYKSANCKSRSEYIEKAIIFYNGYLSAEDNKKYLPNIVISSMRGIVQDSENRTARLLFKIAVELDMMMNVLAAKANVDDITLEKLRARCVEEVKKTNGSISFEEAVKYQKNKK